MDEDLLTIQRRFQGKLVGTEKLKMSVSFVVSRLPKKIQAYVIDYCWFVGSMNDAWAYTFTGNDLADQHLIFLSDDLLRQSSDQIYFSITHELGHVVKGHRNSVFAKQSKEEITKQESEADAFAADYFPKIS